MDGSSPSSNRRACLFVRMCQMKRNYSFEHEQKHPQIHTHIYGVQQHTHKQIMAKPSYYLSKLGSPEWNACCETLPDKDLHYRGNTHTALTCTHFTQTNNDVIRRQTMQTMQTHVCILLSVLLFSSFALQRRRLCSVLLNTWCLFKSAGGSSWPRVNIFICFCIVCVCV